MNRLRQFWYSVVEYLPDPAAPQAGKLPLGVLVGAAVGKMRYVGISARNSLNPQEMEKLDGIGREVLKNPYEAIRIDVEQAIQELGILAPLRVLERVASMNRWSVSISAPVRLELTVPETVRSKKEALDSAMRGLYAQKVLGVQIQTALAKAPADRVLFADVPAYMIPKTRDFGSERAA